jgi:hypothetical protein
MWTKSTMPWCMLLSARCQEIKSPGSVIVISDATPASRIEPFATAFKGSLQAAQIGQAEFAMALQVRHRISMLSMASPAL